MDVFHCRCIHFLFQYFTPLSAQSINVIFHRCWLCLLSKNTQGNRKFIVYTQWRCKNNICEEKKQTKDKSKCICLLMLYVCFIIPSYCDLKKKFCKKLLICNRFCIKIYTCIVAVTSKQPVPDVFSHIGTVYSYEHVQNCYKCGKAHIFASLGSTRFY